MKKINKSILNELQNFVPKSNSKLILENKSSHIVSSAIHLFEQLEKTYDIDTTTELKKKFFSALKNNDASKFEKAIKKANQDNAKD